MLPSISESTQYIDDYDCDYDYKHPFINRLDDKVRSLSSPPYQYGENNHVEYKNVTKTLETLQEQIIQFSFQLVRIKSKDGLVSIAKDTREILKLIMDGIRTNSKNSNEYNRCVEMGVIMFKILAQTRDIVGGKGEYMLFYAMLLEWAKIDITFFEYAIESMVYDTRGIRETRETVETRETSETGETVETRENFHPLGSWKDMKYFLTYMKNEFMDTDEKTNTYTVIHTNSDNMYSKCVNKIVFLINEQVATDIYNLEHDVKHLSPVARWVPREKSKKFGWLYYYLAMNYSQHEIPSDVSHPSYERALNRAFMIYRKIISKLNKALDTTQIKQCDGKWADINFNNVTSITMHKQTNSFLNLKKNGKTVRRESDNDREECRSNYETYLSDVVKGDKKMKGKRVSIIDFVKSAIDIGNNKLPSDSSIVTALNEQWKDNSKMTANMREMVAMCDVSGSMTEENSNPLYSAIGLSIRVAEKSILGPRVMTFSERPMWIQLGTSDSDTFVKQVNKVRTSTWGMSTNFYFALDLIRESIEDNKLPREVVDKLVLVIFSDMQINSVSSIMEDLSAKATLYENITEMFAKMGERLYGEPVKSPHIILWNLRKTTGFPCLSTDKNVSMMSGFSPALLNLFCEKGVDGLREYTPFNTLVNSLKNERYNGFEKVFKSVVGCSY
jgi:hypothetical protein